MKSNPSRRSASTRYLDTLCSELDALTQQLQEAEAATSTAQEEADAKRRAFHELEKRSNSTHWSVTEQRLFREKNQLEAVARQLQQDLVPLREEHARLKRKVNAPVQLEEARVEMAALASLHAELTATRHTRDEVARRIQTLQAEHDALPEQIRLARDSYQGAQAIVAELELQEQLPAFIGVIARAAVARHRAGFSREQGRYEIEIPVEALEAVSTALDADLSAR